jgi:hypothetical protein
MIFKGTGSVWHPKKSRILVDFKECNFEYKTTDPEEIEILTKTPNIIIEKEKVSTEELVHEAVNIPKVEEEVLQGIQEAIITPAEDKMDKEEIRAELEIMGISYDKRMGKEKLLKLLKDNK